MQNSDFSKDKSVGVIQLALLVFTLVVLAALTADTFWRLPAEGSRMIAGVGMFGGLSGLVTAMFLSSPETRSTETREILERLDALQATLKTLRREDAQP